MREALQAVLEDEVDRRQRQADSGFQPKGPSRAPASAAVVLAVISVWFWISPPNALQPRAFPPPPPAVQESGLRIDVYMVAVQVLRFQSTTGRLPATVEEAVTDHIQADRFEYAVTGPDMFLLTAVRGDQVVVYSSDQSLTQLVGSAQLVLEGAHP